MKKLALGLLIVMFGLVTTSAWSLDLPAKHSHGSMIMAKGGGHGPGDGTGNGGRGPKDGTGNGSRTGGCVNL